MAYDEFLADRVTQVLKEKGTSFTAKKMMGGLCFLVDDKMLCGIHIDKKYGNSLLMARIGEERYAIEIKNEACLPMDFTGRPMKGYGYISSDGFDLDIDLNKWIQRCIDFNPLAKSSKRKK